MMEICFQFLFFWFCLLRAAYGANSTNSTATAIEWLGSQWDGNDGKWSSFYIRVGTQVNNYARVLPATGWQETLVVLPQACGDETNPARPCYNGRGLTVNVTNSTTWDSTPPDIYQISLDRNLNLTGNAIYGYDTVGLDVENSKTTLKHQIVGGYEDPSLWLGVFGLGDQPTNFTNGYSDPQPSFLHSLFNQSMIPSLSWGYAAGAIYQLKEYPGSVVFGGYDSARFVTNNVTFQQSADTDQRLVLAVQQITLTDSTQASSSVVLQPYLTRVDSVTPYLWMPNSTCDALSTHFGLSYDSYVDLYYINDAANYTKFQNSDISFTFILSNQEDDPANETVPIKLPFAAFDLQASTQLAGDSLARDYLPFKRASVEQYTLGRAFLQEAYVFADYGRKTFKISQALFPETGATNITNVYPYDAIPTPNAVPKRNSRVGIIIAVAVAGVLLIGIAGILFFSTRCRRKVSTLLGRHPPTMPPAEVREFRAELDSEERMRQELMGSNEYLKPSYGEPIEIGSSDSVEHKKRPVAVNTIPVELPAITYHDGTSPVIQKSKVFDGEGERPMARGRWDKDPIYEDAIFQEPMASGNATLIRETLITPKRSSFQEGRM